MVQRNLFLVLLIGICSVTHVGATPVQWSGNGHYYERIENPYITWDQAYDGAAASSYYGVQGHLMTITSAAEQQFLADNSMLPDGSLDAHRYWIGGYQPEGSPEPSGNWSWVTGESWNYSNFGSGEPNNEGGDQDVIYLGPEGGWDDCRRSFTGWNGGYYIEYGTVVPEPSTLALLIIGTVGLLVCQKKR